jgi:hypothetical protein
MRLSTENQREGGLCTGSCPRRHPVAQFVIAAVIIGTLLTIVTLAHIQQWPGGYDSPGMDLSRRVVFTLASVLELLGAGIIGFALGLTAANRGIGWQQARPIAARSSHTRVALMIICGLFIILMAGNYAYLALTDRIP